MSSAPPSTRRGTSPRSRSKPPAAGNGPSSTMTSARCWVSPRPSGSEGARSMEMKSASAGAGAARKGRGWTLKQLDAQEIERSECGHRRRLFSSEDASPAAFLHLVKIHEARPHYHRLATEYYYVLSGRGTMVLDGEEVALS